MTGAVDANGNSAPQAERRLSNPKKPRPRKLEIIRELYIRDGRLCHYCGRTLLHWDELEESNIGDGKLPINYPTIDHVQPITLGGRWHLENLVLACPRCNAKKGQKDAFVADVQARKQVANASRCDRCDGRGTGHYQDQDKPCPDCRGAGAMSIDRYAELLCDRSIELARLKDKHGEVRREKERLKALLTEAANGGEAWRTQLALAKQAQNYRKTILKMSERISELGGGRPPDSDTVN